MRLFTTDKNPPSAIFLYKSVWRWFASDILGAYRREEVTAQATSHAVLCTSNSCP